MAKKLNRKFFEQNTLKVAKELLGKILVRKWRNKELRGIITETEAYMGFEDKASHASRGITPRTEIMFGEAGRAYIYLIYGMHNCLNIVTEQKNYPAAVLIRGVILHEDLKTGTISKFKYLNGPGKLTKFFHIDRKLNGEDITKSKKMWVEDATNISKFEDFKIKSDKRIGIDYAGKWKNKNWRFYCEV